MSPLEPVSSMVEGADAEAPAGSSERAALVDEHTATSAGKTAFRPSRKAAAAAGLGALMGAAALVARSGGGGFAASAGGAVEVPAEMWDTGRCFTQLSQEYPEDLMELSGDGSRNHDASAAWLQAASAASEAAEEAHAGPLDQHISSKAQEAITDMLNMKDPEEAKKFIRRAMSVAVNQSMSKRRKLKNYIQTLPGNQPTLTPAQQAKAASCSFDILSTLTLIADLGANINDVSQTCKKTTLADRKRIGRKAWLVHRKVCSVNAVEMIGQIAAIGAKIASSVNNCAITAETNRDAVCAAAIMGLITSSAGAGIGTILLNAACHSRLADAGFTASEIGNNKFIDNPRFPPAEGKHIWPPALEGDSMETQGGVRRLLEEQSMLEQSTMEEEESGADARRLMFGGGKSSIMTHCITSVASSMWSLAGAALAINSAAKTCPPKDLITKSEKGNKRMTYRVPQAVCAADVSKILAGFFLTITFIENSIIACTDTLHLNVICAEAVTEVLGSMSLAASTGAGVFLTCDAKTRKFTDFLGKMKSVAGGLNKTLAAHGKKKAADKAAKVADADAGAAAELEEEEDIGLSGAFSRRLAEAGLLPEGIDQHVADLKARFATPADAFRSIGLDLDDKNAPFRVHAKVAAENAMRSAGRQLSEVVTGAADGSAATGDIPQACGHAASAP